MKLITGFELPRQTRCGELRAAVEVERQRREGLQLLEPRAQRRHVRELLAGPEVQAQRREGLQLREPRAQRRHVRELRAGTEVELQRRVSMSRLSGTRRDPGTPRSIFTTLRGAGIQGYLDLRTPLC